MKKYQSKSRFEKFPESLNEQIRKILVSAQVVYSSILRIIMINNFELKTHIIYYFIIIIYHEDLEKRGGLLEGCGVVAHERHASHESK